METVSALIVGLLVTVLGIAGLILASGALDIEILIFGWSLVAFAVLFNFGLIRRHYDRQEAAVAQGGDNV